MDTVSFVRDGMKKIGGEKLIVSLKKSGVRDRLRQFAKGNASKSKTMSDIALGKEFQSHLFFEYFHEDVVLLEKQLKKSTNWKNEFIRS